MRRLAATLGPGLCMGTIGLGPRIGSALADENAGPPAIGEGWVGWENGVPVFVGEGGVPGGWMVTMWNDLVFDPAGNLFMTDDKPRLWKVTPDGQASIWFMDPRLTGLFGFAGGPLGGRIDPTGKFLYFSITVSAAFPGEAVVYRLPLIDHPSASDLQLVHRFPVVPRQQLPPATGLAFAASGNPHLALTATNQIAVLDPAGNQIRRISSPLFDSPCGLAFI